MPGVHIEGINSELLPISMSISGVTTPSDGRFPVAESELSGYQISDMDASGSTEYYGFVNASGAWYILEITNTSARYAKGASGYTTAWTARAEQSYGYYNAVF